MDLTPIQTVPSIIFLNGKCLQNKSDFLVHATQNVLHITLPKNTRSTEPVYIIQLLETNAAAENPFSIRVHCLDNSHATIFEGYYLKNPKKLLEVHTLNEYMLYKNATLEHYLFTHARASSKLNHNFIIHQDENSQYTGTYLMTQKGEHHIDHAQNLHQSGAASTLRALILGRESQIKTLKTTTHHHAAHCTSQTLVRGIAHDNAETRCTGKIIVDPMASKTKAHLDAKKLLLSDTANVHILPELEIYHQDVQCTHGATIGYLDNDALFYLKSRGISDLDAKQLLISAFLQPVLEPIPPNDFVKDLHITNGY